MKVPNQLGLPMLRVCLNENSVEPPVYVFYIAGDISYLFSYPFEKLDRKNRRYKEFEEKREVSDFLKDALIKKLAQFDIDYQAWIPEKIN